MWGCVVSHNLNHKKTMVAGKQHFHVGIRCRACVFYFLVYSLDLISFVWDTIMVSLITFGRYSFVHVLECQWKIARRRTVMPQLIWPIRVGSWVLSNKFNVPVSRRFWAARLEDSNEMRYLPNDIPRWHKALRCPTVDSSKTLHQTLGW